MRSQIYFNAILSSSQPQMSITARTWGTTGIQWYGICYFVIASVHHRECQQRERYPQWAADQQIALSQYHLEQDP